MAYPNGFGDSDLDTFFEDFAIVVTVPSRGITAKAILDSSTETHDFNSQRSEVVVSVVSMLVKASEFATLKKNDPLVADGVSYFVSEINREADGRTMRVHLRYS